MWNRKSAALYLTGVFLLSTCGNGGGGRETDRTSGSSGVPASRPIRIVTTIGMITDIVRNIGGEYVEVTGLMGPGIDPHLYKASEGDVVRMAGADIIFYNGLHLEGKMAELMERIQGRVKTAAVTDGVDRSLLLAPPEFEGSPDPHVWFDVSLWLEAARRVEIVLSEFDPLHWEAYRANADVYASRLDSLDNYVRRRASEIPEELRVLVTAHDAFNYFGRAYGFEVRGLQGISTSSEAGTGDVQSLADFIAQRRIPAVFVETSVPHRFIQALQEAVRARGFEVNIGGNLFSDAMGDPGTPDGTYTGMIRHNIDTITGALTR